jgi:adenine-specific DNA methylase
LNPNSQNLDVRSLEDRRKLGAYYTPENISDILSNWAIRDRQSTILEPSFGGCGFLQSAHRRLENLGASPSQNAIYGCDIDLIAFQYLSTVLGSPVDLDRFVHADFLKIGRPETWPAEFDCILGNPPYIPYQSLEAEYRRDLMGRTWPVALIGGRASLWAYFIANAISLLKGGGRMAWVLPGAFLQADYASSLRKYLAENFAKTIAIVVRERIFAHVGTDEETVILLADGHKRKPKTPQLVLGEVKTHVELAELVEAWEGGSWSGTSSATRPAALSMNRKYADAFEKFALSSANIQLGQIAKVQIGLVTGANSFFVLNKQALADAGLYEEDCIKILSKFHAAKGLSLSTEDLSRYAQSGGRAFLVNDGLGDTSGRLKDYLETFDKAKIASTSTFRKRKLWSQPNDGKIPDAFLPVMHHAGPRLVLNIGRLTCTNTIHRVYFNADISDHQQKLSAISMLTTFSQLSAELVGRRYGSGVLKHEPREAEKIRLLLPDADAKDIKRSYNEIDQLLRSDDKQGAQQLADDFIFSSICNEGWKHDVFTLRLALEEMRNRRRPQTLR